MIIALWEFQNAIVAVFPSSPPFPILSFLTLSIPPLLSSDCNMKDKVEFVLFVNPGNG
jgi:hypothetical protein